MENISNIEHRIDILNEKIATLRKGSEHWGDLVDTRNALREYVNTYYTNLHRAQMEASFG